MTMNYSNRFEILDDSIILMKGCKPIEDALNQPNLYNLIETKLETKVRLKR
uniref:Uncharacterized protein n=1 Tax=Rhizophora mucronata TaxID=61149 RepID=A0A2P2N388_RHIMU